MIFESSIFIIEFYCWISGIGIMEWSSREVEIVLRMFTCNYTQVQPHVLSLFISFSWALSSKTLSPLSATNPPPPPMPPDTEIVTAWLPGTRPPRLPEV